MIADGHLVGDGSWELKVLVTDLAVERCLRVKGDLHIGGVMLRLVEELGKLYAVICPYLADWLMVVETLTSFLHAPI